MRIIRVVQHRCLSLHCAPVYEAYIKGLTEVESCRQQWSVITFIGETYYKYLHYSLVC